MQILLSLLKANNIRKFVVSPGTTNVPLVGSIQNDPYFEVYSSVDERSAAYIACGMAAESGEPVVLSCTGATASRNYYPGLSEAYYRKLPILAVTSHVGYDRIGHLIPQSIDRRNLPNDLVKLSVSLPLIRDERDESFVVIETNKAIQELAHNGGGPVHIDLFTSFDTTFTADTLPVVRAIKRIHAWDCMPEMPSGVVGIYIGSHVKFSESLNKAVDKFCATFDAVAICDHTSGYYGPYRVQPIIYNNQQFSTSNLPEFDLLVHIGEVSAAEGFARNKAKNVWRVNEDGEIRDTFKKLTKVFQMSPEMFFNHYGKDGNDKHNLVDFYHETINSLYDEIPELPFSNVYVAKELSKRLPAGSLFHLGVSNTRRSYNMFPIPKGVESSCNVGCCGIDGCTSSLIGASLVNKDRLCFVAVGDLMFFYDMNSLGNRHVGPNVRILLINNGIGAEFKMPFHICQAFGESANPFMAAQGHFGNKSTNLVKHYATDLGYEYLSASNKEELEKVLTRFTTPVLTDRPMVLEVFTSYEDENIAIDIMRHLQKDIKGVIKTKVIDILGEKGVSILRRKLKK